MKLTLFLTEQCSRKCTYCDIGNMKYRSKPSLSYIKKYLPIISKMSNIDKIVLTGGEPGMLNEVTLDFIFETIKQKHIQVNTNGLFLKRYYNKYKNYIDNVMYHPVSEITEEIKYEPNIDNIQYHFPVHKKNIKYLTNFLDRYPHIIFEVSPYDSKIEQNDLKLKLNDFITIYNIIKNRNATNYSKTIFNRIIKLWDLKDNYRELCISKFREHSIDFVNGKIKKCICSHTNSSWVFLSTNNLNNLNNLKFDKAESCYNCFHVFNIIQLENILRLK